MRDIYLSSGSFFLIDTLNMEKTIFLPSASTSVGREIVLLQGNGSNSLLVKTTGLDFIDLRSNTVIMGGPQSSVSFLSLGATDWSILHSNPYIQPKVTLPGWQSDFSEGGIVHIDRSQPSSILTITGPNNTNSNNGYALAYIYSSNVRGSLTYDYAFSTIDGVIYDWPFEYHSSNIPIPFEKIYTNERIATSENESGRRTISWANQPFGYYIVFGVYTIDNLFGPGSLVIRNVPRVNP